MGWALPCCPGTGWTTISSRCRWLFDGYPLRRRRRAGAVPRPAGPEDSGWRRSACCSLAPLLLWGRKKSDPLFGWLLIAIGAAGFAYLLLQGFGIGLRGWRFEWLAALFGELDDRQFGMGYGALLVAGAFLFLFTLGLAGRGAVGGDVFVVGSIGFVVAVVAIFIFMPIAPDDGQRAGHRRSGAYSLATFLAKLFSERLWGLGCLAGGARCGVAWNSLFLAVLVGVLTTRSALSLRWSSPAPASATAGCCGR